MKFWEAMRLLEEGKRVRKTCWDEDCYIYLDDGIITDGLGFKGATDIVILDDEWEIYVNWNEIPKWTKVQVRDNNNDRWLNRYFIRSNDNGYYTVSERDEFVSETTQSYENFKYIRLYKEDNEKQEHDGCDCCNKGISICDNRDGLGIELHSAKGKLVAYGIDGEGWDISVECEVNYCPMCGRKLNK